MGPACGTGLACGTGPACGTGRARQKRGGGQLQSTAVPSKFRGGEGKGSLGAEKGEVTGGKAWAGNSGCQVAASQPFPKTAFPGRGWERDTRLDGTPVTGGLPRSLRLPTPHPSLSMATGPALPWVTAPHRTPRLLCARGSCGEQPPAQGECKCSALSSSPRNTSSKKCCEKLQAGGKSPQRHFPRPGETSVQRKQKVVTSKGGSSGLSEAPRHAQHRQPRWVRGQAPAAPLRSHG